MTDQYAELRDTLQRLRDADTSGQIREAIESYRMIVLPGIVGALLAERDALAQDAARLKHEAAEYIERLEDRLFAAGAMEQAPCFCCGYNGPGYYQPGSHPCAKRHHELRHGVSEI